MRANRRTLGGLSALIATMIVPAISMAGDNNQAPYTPPAGGKIWACVQANGHVEIVSGPWKCGFKESPIWWNQTGPKGDTGAQGPKGEPGATGPVGATGPAGVDGAVGATGPAGADGATGATGPAGPAGAQGDTGPMGPKGDVGEMGLLGPMGPMGPMGFMGPPGADGTAGSAGPVGPAGPPGPPGPAGGNVVPAFDGELPANVAAFLRAPPIDGESQDPKHPKWIELRGIEFGVNQTGSFQSAGKANLHDFSVVAPAAGRALPVLMRTMAKGTHLAAVDIDLCALGQAKCFLRMRLTGVRISTASTELDDEQHPMTRFTLAPTQKVDWTYDPSGEPGSAPGLPLTQLGFDVPTELPSGTAPLPGVYSTLPAPGDAPILEFWEGGTNASSKVSLYDQSVSRPFDIHSMGALSAALHGNHVPATTIETPRPDLTPLFWVELENVRVTSFEVSGLQEKTALAYNKITWAYQPLDSKGFPLPVVKTSWDVLLNN